jgi:hypothetical protein
MTELLLFIAILLPFAYLGLLMTAKSHTTRRLSLMSSLFFLFVVLCFCWILNPLLQSRVKDNLPSNLFEGEVMGFFLNYFIGETWVSIFYMIIILIAGHFANQHAIRKIGFTSLK